jgi:hypothetical protein
MKMAAYRRIVVGTPFPLMGKGRDRGAREPIRTITPTFVLPRQGEGLGRVAGRLLYKSVTRGPNPIFKGEHRTQRRFIYVTFVLFMVKEFDRDRRFIARNGELAYAEP